MKKISITPFVLKTTIKSLKNTWKNYLINISLKPVTKHHATDIAFREKCNLGAFIASSLIPKKPGYRRKNDFRDAQNLAQHYAHGMLAIVHPPTEKQESVRHLVRCRMAMRENEKSVKQQINSLLLTQDFRWPKTKWTGQHCVWLKKLILRDKHSQQVLDELFGLLDYLGSRIQYLDKEIEEIAQSEIYTPSVKKLKAFKGIQTLTAMVLIPEITDFGRFPNPRALMAFLGLIPSEDSSDDVKKPGTITKAGNSRCRTQLI